MRTSRTSALITLALAAGLTATVTASGAYAAHEELVVTGLTQNDKLVTFVAGTGERLSQVKVTGIAEGQRLVSIDYRPSNGLLYGVAVNGTQGFVYTIDDATAKATALPISFPITGAVSADVNPAADRLRVVSSDEHNYRINLDMRVVITDKPLTYGPGSNPTVVGAAYTNNDNDPATATTLYDVDAATDNLVKQTPPNDGTLVPVGPLGIDIDDATGFDIYTEGTANIALLSTRTADGTLVYTVDLTTGAVNKTATSGVRAQGAPVVDIAVDPGQ